MPILCGLEPEALAVESEAVAKRIAIESVVGGVVASNAALVARSIVWPPQLHGRALSHLRILRLCRKHIVEIEG